TPSPIPARDPGPRPAPSPGPLPGPAPGPPEPPPVPGPCEDVGGAIGPSTMPGNDSSADAIVLTGMFSRSTGFGSTFASGFSRLAWRAAGIVTASLPGASARRGGSFILFPPPPPPPGPASLNQISPFKGGASLEGVGVERTWRLATIRNVRIAASTQ